MNQFESMSESELGVLAKDYLDCADNKSCKDCACEGVICHVPDAKKEIRKFATTLFAVITAY